MENTKLNLENKIIGAFIRYECNDELDFKLEHLVEYQRKNNIEKINRYYTADDGDLVPYYKVITDIFEERIDTLLVVGNVESLIPDYEILEKIEQNVELIKV